MEFSRELLFFFSLLGVFNAIILATYFFWIPKKFANPYLGFLMLALAVRVGKSVFYYFNNSLSSAYIHLGLAACMAIGPLLLLFVNSQKKEFKGFHPLMLLHFLPVAGLVIFGEFFTAYHADRELWAYIVQAIYLHWGIYIGLSVYLYFKKIKPLQQINKFWIISILSGIGLIWLAYFTSGFTSYIAGALTFSAAVYWLVVILISGRTVKQNKPSAAKATRMPKEEAERIRKKLFDFLEADQSYKNANLRMSEVAKQLSLPSHQLSHFINEHLQMSFSQFINSYRIEEAKKLLLENPHLTVEAIGYESGFNSPSSFYTTFKNETGQTPAAFRKHQEADLTSKL